MKKKFLFALMPIFAICLTSCGENEVVSNYIIDNGTPDEKDGYYIEQKRESANGIMVTTRCYYYPETKQYYLNSFYTQVDGSYKFDVDGTAGFTWGKYRRGIFYTSITIRHYKTETYRFKFVVDRLRECPNVEFKVSNSISVITFENQYVNVASLVSAAAEVIAVSTSVFQEIITTHIDSGISIW